MGTGTHLNTITETTEIITNQSINLKMYFPIFINKSM